MSACPAEDAGNRTALGARSNCQLPFVCVGSNAPASQFGQLLAGSPSQRFLIRTSGSRRLREPEPCRDGFRRPEGKRNHRPPILLRHKRLQAAGIGGPAALF